MYVQGLASRSGGFLVYWFSVSGWSLIIGVRGVRTPCTCGLTCIPGRGEGGGRREEPIL